MLNTTLNPLEAMLCAINMARKGLGFVAPNPVVGCVILDKKGGLLSRSYHKTFGGPHAEVNAINEISDISLLEGASVFVTLEPCAHVGKTPSCAHFLKKFPIKEVIYGAKDPNPLVSGQGAEILNQSGVICYEFRDFIKKKYEEKDNDLENEINNIIDQLDDLNAIFFENMIHKKSYVALKVATSLDGQISLSNGESQWITGEDSRSYVHSLRGQYDAILVGRGTFEADNPSLNIRSESFKNKKNKVIVLDPQMRSFDKLENSNLLKCHDPQDIYWVISESVESSYLEKKKKSLESSDFYNHIKKVKIIQTPSFKEGSMDLNALKSKLFENKIYTVFVEGGAGVYSQFIKQKAFHKLYHFLSPSILGQGVNWTKNLNIKTLDERLYLKLIEQKKFKKDWLMTYVQQR